MVFDCFSSLESYISYCETNFTDCCAALESKARYEINPSDICVDSDTDDFVFSDYETALAETRDNEIMMLINEEFEKRRDALHKIAGTHCHLDSGLSFNIGICENCGGQVREVNAVRLTNLKELKDYFIGLRDLPPEVTIIDSDMGDCGCEVCA